MQTIPTSQLNKSLRRGLFGVLAVLVLAGLIFTTAQPAAAVQGAFPPPNPMPPTMALIYKSASRLFLAQGQSMTYTIHLATVSATPLQASVTDPLPAGLDYVAGTASHSGVYDPATRSLSWTNVPVTQATPVNLTFEVTEMAVISQVTPVANTATINLNGLTLQRTAWVVLMPAAPQASPLGASFKSAEPFLLGPGDSVTYTIHLINSGTTAATVTVSDPLPAQMTYVDGSASSGGVYDTATHTLTWTGIAVPSKAPLLLTFKASALAALPAATHPVLVTNTATITDGSVSLTRSAFVLLIPTPAQGSPLAGSFKSASRHMVSPGDKFTYTIYLHNSSDSALPASVSDPLPVGVTYVDGSANAGGTYDAATRTLTWTDLSVIEGSPVSLTFDVTTDNPVQATPGALTPITNTATITSGTLTLKRSARVLVGPPTGGDTVPPVVHSVIIGDSDVYTSPDVTLHINATDNVKVTEMCIKEWVLSPDPMPHWQPVKDCTKWVPFEADYPYTLTSQSGTHFVEVWVADAALNVSRLTRSAIDFASLLLPDTTVAQGGVVPYLVYYPAGVSVTADLTVKTGDARLFIWHPGSMFVPDDSTAAAGSTTFTTPTAGVYLFLVSANAASTFTLSITPGGGPVVVPAAAAGTSGGIQVPALSSSPAFNPILPQSGLDPLSVSVAPLGPFDYQYMPVILR